MDVQNYFMNGVDVADQLRAYYCLQMICGRVWMPLFFWIFDVSIVNAYKIYMWSQEKYEPIMPHKMFRIELAKALLKRGSSELASSDPKYTTPLSRFSTTQPQDSPRGSARIRLGFLSPNDSESPKHKSPYYKAGNPLPTTRLQRCIPHLPEPAEKRNNCVQCRYKKANDSTSSSTCFTTYTICGGCNVYLCYNKSRNCFKEYHTKMDP